MARLKLPAEYERVLERPLVTYAAASPDGARQWTHETRQPGPIYAVIGKYDGEKWVAWWGNKKRAAVLSRDMEANALYEDVQVIEGECLEE